MNKILRFILLLSLCVVSIAQPASAQSRQSKIDASLLNLAPGEPVEFLVFLDRQADLSEAARFTDKVEKGRFVYEQLSSLANRTQGPLLAALETLAQTNPTLEFRPYWVANMIWVRGDGTTLQTLAQRADVDSILANPKVRQALPEQQADAAAQLSTDTIEWGIAKVRAPEVWAQGYTGQGTVVGGQDTGYDWQHPALKDKYRGWNGFTADHNYNWHDAIHDTNTSCGVNSPFPCDDNYHGTHTMGTMVGDGGARRIGMAPGAKWIGCRNMAEGFGTPATYAECYQWFIAPTDLNGQNPRPDLAPDVINNSWSCPPSEGCTTPDVLLPIVQAVRAAGILTVHSAGNSGSSCSTINTPSAIYDESFTVGNTDSNDNIHSSSSRGPVTVDGSGRLKPDVSAPGTMVYSSVPGGGYTTLTGTSMSGPHAAGMAALLISIDPSLSGDVDRIEQVIRDSATPRTTALLCGGIPGSQVPNPIYGYGRIDAFQALSLLTSHTLTVTKSHPAFIYTPGEPITYTLQVSHEHLYSEAAHAVVLTDTLPAGTTFVSATDPYTLNGDVVRWELGSLAAGTSVAVQLQVLTPPVWNGPLINSDYGVSSTETPFSTGVPLYLFQPDQIELRFFPLAFG